MIIYIIVLIIKYLFVGTTKYNLPNCTWEKHSCIYKELGKNEKF